MSTRDQPRVVLGFDYGAKRIGVAVGQELTATAQPLMTLATQPATALWIRLTKVIQQWQPALLVVGLPQQADGRANALSAAVQSFAQQLNERFALPVETIDERLSSYAAERYLQQHNQGKRTRKSDIDCMAAALILESWLRA